MLCEAMITIAGLFMTFITLYKVIKLQLIIAIENIACELTDIQKGIVNRKVLTKLDVNMTN